MNNSEEIMMVPLCNEWLQLFINSLDLSPHASTEIYQAVLMFKI